jgi:16S rRNA A1518/A1519 N6-dimethyltransferase RsmA/KsgA/DIM1 with predicted DNA glycosylase/AP lyase activity
MIIYVLSLIVALVIIYFFTSKKRSPIPYFPSNKQDIPLILKALNLRNNQTVIDLGAGDGIVVFEAAKEAKKRKLNTQFIAVEINPILVFVLHLRKIFHPNRKNIKVIYADMFKLNVSTFTDKNATIFLYISPWFMEKVYKKLKEDLGSFKLVSYFYALKNKKETKKLKGVHKLFVYED